MKKLIFLFIVIIIVSCKNETTKSNIDLNEVMEIEKEVTKDISDTSDNQIFLNKELTKEKLQELYDLIVLKNEHPEFKVSINKQLKSYVNDSIPNKAIAEGTINNIALKGDIIQVSDSIQKVELYFDFLTKNTVKKDSIWAIFTSKTIIVNGEELKSTKVTFSYN